MTRFGHPECTQVDDPTRPDDLLVEQARAGDERAFDLLSTRYHREIRAFLTARLNADATTADDLTSEVFAKVFRALDRFQRGSFRGWVYQIARNTLIDHHRAHRPTTSLDPSGGIEVVSPEPAPDEQAIAAEARRQLLAALDTLGPIPHRILELRLKGYPLADICADLGMEVSAVKSAQHRAFKRLRAHLHDPNDDPPVDRRTRP